jgi:hypothetical protein
MTTGAITACRCRHCRREFAFVEGFHPSTTVCFHCGPYDQRQQAIAKARELRERLAAEAVTRAAEIRDATKTEGPRQ